MKKTLRALLALLVIVTHIVTTIPAVAYTDSSISYNWGSRWIPGTGNIRAIDAARRAEIDALLAQQGYRRTTLAECARHGADVTVLINGISSTRGRRCTLSPETVVWADARWTPRYKADCFNPLDVVAVQAEVQAAAQTESAGNNYLELFLSLLSQGLSIWQSLQQCGSQYGYGNQGYGQICGYAQQWYPQQYQQCQRQQGFVQPTQQVQPIILNVIQKQGNQIQNNTQTQTVTPPVVKNPPPPRPTPPCTPFPKSPTLTGPTPPPINDHNPYGDDVITGASTATDPTTASNNSTIPTRARRSLTTAAANGSVATSAPAAARASKLAAVRSGTLPIAPGSAEQALLASTRTTAAPQSRVTPASVPAPVRTSKSASTTASVALQEAPAADVVPSPSRVAAKVAVPSATASVASSAPTSLPAPPRAAKVLASTKPSVPPAVATAKLAAKVPPPKVSVPKAGPPVVKTTIPSAAEVVKLSPAPRVSGGVSASRGFSMNAGTRVGTSSASVASSIPRAASVPRAQNFSAPKPMSVSMPKPAMKFTMPSSGGMGKKKG